jgi:hypothetical protein
LYDTEPGHTVAISCSVATVGYGKWRTVIII